MDNKIINGWLTEREGALLQLYVTLHAQYLRKTDPEMAKLFHKDGTLKGVIS